MTSKSGKAAAAWGAIVLVVLAAAVPAAELSYGVDVGAGYTDNAALLSANEQDDTIAMLGANLRLDHESARIKANITSTLEYRDYLNNTFSSELLGNFIADSQFDFVKERFSWALDDTFGQSLRNDLSADTPANRENVNFLSTGPDFSLPLGARNTMVLRGRYSDVHYENSNLGNNRIRGELALQHDLSEASILSLNATAEQVSYDDAVYADFDRTEGFLAYEVKAARTQMSFQAGMTEISSVGQTDDGWLGRVKISRNASSALTVGLKLGHEISDAGNAFVQQQALQPVATDAVSVQQTAVPFLNEYIELFSQFARNRTSMYTRAGYYDETYKGDPLLDRKRLMLELILERSLSASMTAHANAEYSGYDYSEVSRKFAELDGSVGLRWLLARTTSLSLDYVFLGRNDDNNSGEYRANEIWLRFGYQVGEGAGGSAFPGL